MYLATLIHSVLTANAAALWAQTRFVTLWSHSVEMWQIIFEELQQNQAHNFFFFLKQNADSRQTTEAVNAAF